MQTANILKLSQVNGFSTHLQVFQKKSLGEEGPGTVIRNQSSQSPPDTLSAKSINGTKELFQSSVISEIRSDLNSLMKGNLSGSIVEKINDLNSEYWSEDSIAGRLFSFSVGFFGRYREMMKEISLSETDLRREFVDTVKKALSKGLKKSGDAISGGGTASADIEGIAAKVEEKLDRFSQTK